MAINTKNKTFVEKVNLSIQYRGKVIHNISFLEMAMNAYIAYYFCGDDDKKMTDMIVLILGDERTSLSSKAQIFHKLAISYDKTWYDSYISIRKPIDKKVKFYTMNQDMVYIIEERNVFAHRIFDSGIFTDEELPDDIIRFTRFKNEIQPIDYDKNKLDELLQLTINLKNHFEKKLKVMGTYPLSI